MKNPELLPLSADTEPTETGPEPVEDVVAPEQAGQTPVAEADPQEDIEAVIARDLDIAMAPYRREVEGVKFTREDLHALEADIEETLLGQSMFQKEELDEAWQQERDRLDRQEQPTAIEHQPSTAEGFRALYANTARYSKWLDEADIRREQAESIGSQLIGNTYRQTARAEIPEDVRNGSRTQAFQGTRKSTDVMLNAEKDYTAAFRNAQQKWAAIKAQLIKPVEPIKKGGLGKSALKWLGLKK